MNRLRLTVLGLCCAGAAAQIPECSEVKTTASGLQYCVLQQGRSEPGPKALDNVEVHYTGWLRDGTKFDSSRDRGRPSRFGVSEVIKGWTEGLQLMSPGSRYKLIIPAALGYGAQATGQIPANSDLIFDVELLSVQRMPDFVPANKEQQKQLECGLVYEVLAAGDGPMVDEEASVALKFAIFSADGVLKQCSEQQNDHRISGTKGTLPFPFLQELVGIMRRGMKVRVEVPAKTMPSLPIDSVWLLELTGVHSLPKFRALAKDAAVETESGLKYEVLKMGTGPRPKATDTVSALYTGWLLDGTVFDSAHGRGAPSEFPLNRVIKGWTEGLQLMPVGSIFLFEIPSELAYGTRGSPPKIEPNTTLLFLVELVDVK